MRKCKWLLIIGFSLVPSIWAATNNSGNAPTFLWFDICTNGIGDANGAEQIPRMEPNVFDIGVDLNADGTIDRWLSEEKSEYLGRDNADKVALLSWRRFYIRLDADAGKQAKIRIVDKSAQYYMAVNAIRLNYADGKIVPNPVPNGWFEDSTPLRGWTILEGNVTDPAKLILSDEQGQYNSYSKKFFCTTTKINSGDYSETCVIESDAFPLTPPTSFVYGMVSGGGSEKWNIPGSGGSDNVSGVYLDIGTETQDPNGQYDEGVDIPLTGFAAGDTANIRNQIHPVFLNTSGQEGKRCQVVAFDDSAYYHVVLDSFRMNFDYTTIQNGGFDEGIPTLESDPTATDWFTEAVHEWNEHPSGSIPGWTVKITHPEMGGSVFFFDQAAHTSQFSGRTYVGTAGFTNDDRANGGVELRSNVFVIQPIPDPKKNVFLQFACAQGCNRTRFVNNGTKMVHGTVELHVDVDNNGKFDDAADYKYVLQHQGMGQNLNTSNLDLWSYPEPRFYILPEHQSKKAQIFVEDTLQSGYGWMCVDDFFVWNGAQAVLPFSNSDFESGNMENWTEEVGIGGGSLRSWLSASQDCFENDPDCKAEHLAMNNRHSMADGKYAADTAANEYGVGDDGTGRLTSVAFPMPSIQSSTLPDWSILE